MGFELPQMPPQDRFGTGCIVPKTPRGCALEPVDCRTTCHFDHPTPPPSAATLPLQGRVKKAYSYGLFAAFTSTSATTGGVGT